MTAVISKMTEMVIMLLVGVVCAKRKVTGPEFNHYASALLANVLLSATILKSILGVDVAISNEIVGYVLGLYLVMMFAAYGLGKLMARFLPASEDDRAVFECLAVYMNVAFIGFPMVDAVYGSGEASFYACLSAMPFNMFFYSLGMMRLQGVSFRDIGFRFLNNVPLLATILGIVVFLLKLPVPAVILNSVSTLAGATIPLSMLILGTSLGGISLKTALDDWRIYVMCLVRLLICPIAVNLLLHLFVENEVMIGVVTILAATPSAVVLTPLCIQYGKNEQLSSKGVFISTVLSAVTLPFIIWVLL